MTFLALARLTFAYDKTLGRGNKQLTRTYRYFAETSSIVPRTFLHLLALLSSSFLAAQGSLPPDGPYLMYEGDSLVAHWAWPEERRADAVTWQEDSLMHLPEFPSFRPEEIQPQKCFHRSSQVNFAGIDSVAVMSDIHGQYDASRKLLLNAGVMNDDHEWTYGKGHLVIVGDIFDRGPQVNETLWMIYHLEQKAKAAGGRVHFLLGNHETMILSGDVRYLNNRYLSTTALLTTPYRDLYGKDSYLGRWLRSLPLTIRINDMVFVHGGFSLELLKEVGTLSNINNTYHKYLIDEDANIAIAENEKLKVLHGREGPLWYRGYFLDKELTQKDVDKILRKLKAERMIVGHTSFNAIQSYFNGKVFGVDSSIKFGSTGELLVVENGDLERVTLFGERVAVTEADDKR